MLILYTSLKHKNIEVERERWLETDKACSVFAKTSLEYVKG